MSPETPAEQQLPEPQPPTAPLPAEQQPQPPRPVWRRRWFIPAVAGGVLLVAAVVATAVAIYRPGGPAAPKTIDMNGSLTLQSTSHRFSGGCNGTGGYSDLSQGAQVTVTDEAGTVLGVGNLGLGSPVGIGCRWEFRVTGLPSGKKFYGVTISRRGTIQYTEQQVHSGNVELSIGS